MGHLGIHAHNRRALGKGWVAFHLYTNTLVFVLNFLLENTRHTSVEVRAQESEYFDQIPKGSKMGITNLSLSNALLKRGGRGL